MGDHSRIGAGSWLDRDVIVEQGAVIAGNVRIGPRSRVGTGARVGSDVAIHRRARVDPDAVVLDAAVVRRRSTVGRSEFEIAA